MPPKSPLVLMILDGWGYTEQEKHNAINHAHTPQWDEWWQHAPHALLQASGSVVGLPEGQMGNSEVGHMHIGAGRVIQQDFTRINEAIKTGDFARNTVFLQTLAQLKNTGKTLHILGLLSPGGVHSHENHLLAILTLCDQQHFHKVCLHLFLDGRDTPPQSALESVARLNEALESHPVGSICSITGRYYAMDRDNRWERVEPVYQLLTQGQAKAHFNEASVAIKAYYDQQISDEFIPPTLIGPGTTIEDGDAVLCFNFRSDRVRQLTAALVDTNFHGFKRQTHPQLLSFISMTQYDKNLPTAALFPPIPLTNTLGEVLAQHQLRQLRIAETEKYAHVTFFFNGGKEDVLEGEERLLIPSPKIATYNLKPEMSATELTAALIKAINSKAFDVIICNYANADMVGHTGDFKATVSAIECLDSCMHDVWQALSLQGGCLLITADHGNAETMYDDNTKQAHTAHTSELVPLVYVGGDWHFTQTHGRLTDIAPTILTLLGISPPKEMTGVSLLEKNHVLA